MKRRFGVTERERDGWIRNGCGQGKGASFVPFHNIRDVAGGGVATWVKDHKTGRDHRLVNPLLRWYFVTLIYEPVVTNIYEGWALLPLQACIRTAKRFGLDYPTYPESSTEKVLTTFMVEFAGGKLQPLFLERSDRLEAARRFRTSELAQTIAIQLLFWKARKKELIVLSEKHLSIQKARNLWMLYPAMIQPEEHALKARVQEFASLFQEHWAPDRTLSQILQAIQTRMNLPPDKAHKAFAQAVWMRKIPVELSCGPIVHYRPVRLVQPKADESATGALNVQGLLDDAKGEDQADGYRPGDAQ